MSLRKSPKLIQCAPMPVRLLFVASVLLLLCGCGSHPPTQSASVGKDINRSSDNRNASAQSAIRNSQSAIAAPSAANKSEAVAEVILPPELRLDSSVLEPGAPARGFVYTTVGSDQVRLLWLDEANRVTGAMEVLQHKAGEPFSFTFPMPAGSFGSRHKLALARAHQGAPADFKIEASETFSTRVERDWNDYVVLDAGGVPALRWLPNASEIELGLQRDENPLILADLASRRRAYAESRDPKLLERLPPLFDEAAIAAARSALAGHADNKPDSAPFWSWGEGLELSGGCAPFDGDISPATLDVFRGWLQNRYRSLTALNAAWGMAFRSWADVRPPETDAVKAAQNPAYAAQLAALTKNGSGASPGSSGNLPRIAEKENFAAWSDFRAFNDFAFARLLRELRAQLLASERTARAGILNAQPPLPWGGWDYTALAKSLDWIEEHDAALGRDLLRSFAPQTRCVSALTSAGNTDRHRLWDRWLRGDNGCVVGATLNSPAQADSQANPVQDVLEMAGGLTLMRQAARQTAEGVAIYYSPRSFYLHWMLDSAADGPAWLERDGPYQAAHSSALLQIKAWSMLLEDLGYTPQYIQPSKDLAAQLQKSKVRVVILPKVLSLSDSEAGALRDFARGGGFVIADGACGTFDGNGKRVNPSPSTGQPAGALDADFGIARKNLHVFEVNGEFTGETIRTRVALRSPAGESIGPESAELRVLEPGIVARGGAGLAASASGAAALVSKAAGRGRFFYLNLSMQDYPQLRAAPEAADFQFHGMSAQEYTEQFGSATGGEALRLVVGDILSDLVPPCPLQVRDSSGRPLRGIRRVRYSLGKESEMFGLLPVGEPRSAGVPPATGAGETPAPPATIRVSTPSLSARHWYDMRTGAYLGFGAEAQTALEPDSATLLCALPYRAERIIAKLRRTDPRGTFKVTATLSTTDGGRPGRHIFHLRIDDPSGVEVPYYAQNVLAEDGQWNGTIHLALSEAPGNYRLQIRDVLTRATANVTLAKESAEYQNLSVEPEKTMAAAE